MLKYLTDTIFTRWKMDLSTVLYAFVAAVFYAGSFYLKNRQQTGEAFDPGKFAATLILAVVIALVAILTGNPLTEEDLITQLISYAGIISILESWIKLLFRGLTGKGVATKARAKR